MARANRLAWSIRFFCWKQPPMSLAWHKIRSLSLLLVLPMLQVGCARQGLNADPAEIPTLQEQLRQNPGDLTTQTRLGIALYKDGRFEQSKTTLANAIDAGAEFGAAYLYLGLSNESLNDWAAARTAYTTYLEVGNFGPLKDRLENRLLLIVRNELQAAAQAALAQEAALVSEPPQPRTVAVFPFRLVSEDEGLWPLQVALADMMITDLAISNALTVLERTQIQSLLDEMALSEAGYADPATGARAGRLLRAEHVVQGVLTTLGEQNIQFDAEVMNTVQAQSAGSVSDQDQLEAIFDMEKTLVFQILDVLGAALTPAEREAINDNRAESILAFLAYGEGLMAMDRGDFQAASNFFQQAASRDGSFTAAQTRRRQADGLNDAVTTDIESSADETGAVTGVSDAGEIAQTDNLLQETSQDVNPSGTTAVIDQGTTTTAGRDNKQASERDSSQEATRQEGAAATTARVTISIRRPGGEL